VSLSLRVVHTFEAAVGFAEMAGIRDNAWEADPLLQSIWKYREKEKHENA
jgi:hypothetical protein